MARAPRGEGNERGASVAPVFPYAAIEPAAEAPKGKRRRNVLVEAKLTWGRDLLEVRHVAPKRRNGRVELRVFDLDLNVPGGGGLLVAREDEKGRLALVLPNGALVPRGCRIALRLGRTTLRLALVADDASVPKRRFPDPRIALGIIGAAALHVVVLALAVTGRASPYATEEADRKLMQSYLASAEARAMAELTSSANDAAPEVTPGGTSAASAKNDEGTAGNPARTHEGARAKTTKLEDDVRRPSPITVEATDGRPEAETFGILALLAGTTPDSFRGSSPFEIERGNAAMGNIFGTTIHDAAGVGGLGLHDAGSGAGGLADAVPLGAIGTVGRSTGVGQGFGCCGGRVVMKGHHQVRTPTLMVGQPRVNGRLPPEAIQRVVRQNAGRLRACYATGLLRSPDLEGRVAVKFVIDRGGDVALAALDDASFPDASVASCVVRAYQTMTFPPPEGGIVTVVYPVVFTRTEP